MNTSDGTPTLADLQSGGRPALARALAAIEQALQAPAESKLLDWAFASARAHVVLSVVIPDVRRARKSAIFGWRALRSGILFSASSLFDPKLPDR